MYREAQARDVPPYLRKLSPGREWEFDGAALAVDITLGLVVVGLALALNEAAQVALGNRPPADCHPYGPPPRPPRGPWPPPRPGPRRPH